MGVPKPVYFFAPVMILSVDLKVLTWFRQLKDFNELVRAQYLVGFAGAKSRRDVLYGFRSEHDGLTVGAYATHDKLIDKALDVKLSEHECLSGLIKADESPVFVPFSFWILGLRVIDALVLRLQKLAVQHESVLTLRL